MDFLLFLNISKCDNIVPSLNEKDMFNTNIIKLIDMDLDMERVYTCIQNNHLQFEKSFINKSQELP